MEYIGEIPNCLYQTIIISDPLGKASIGIIKDHLDNSNAGDDCGKFSLTAKVKFTKY